MLLLMEVGGVMMCNGQILQGIRKIDRQMVRGWLKSKEDMDAAMLRYLGFQM